MTRPATFEQRVLHLERLTVDLAIVVESQAVVIRALARAVKAPTASPTPMEALSVEEAQCAVQRYLDIIKQMLATGP